MLNAKLKETLDNQVISCVEIFNSYNEDSAVSILESLMFDGTIDGDNDELCEEVLSYLLNTKIEEE